MPSTDFLAENSIYIENTFRHAFLFDVCQYLSLKEPPIKVTILNAEVDDSGIELVLNVGEVIRQIQMKTLNKRDAPNPYNIADSVFSIAGGCVIWMCYNHLDMRPTRYHLLGGPQNNCMRNASNFPIGKKQVKGKKVDRAGYRHVKTKEANQRDLTLAKLMDLLFFEENFE